MVLGVLRSPEEDDLENSVFLAFAAAALTGFWRMASFSDRSEFGEFPLLEDELAIVRRRFGLILLTKELIVHPSSNKYIPDLQ